MLCQLVFLFYAKSHKISGYNYIFIIEKYDILYRKE